MKIRTITTVRISLNKREGRAVSNALRIAMDSGQMPREDVATVSYLRDALPLDTAISTNTTGKAVSHGTTR